MVLFTLMHCQFFLWVRVVVFKFQIYFSYIVAISFIGGGNQSTRRKPEYPEKTTYFIGVRH